MTAPSYDYWRKALAGEKPKMYVDDPQLGFYRKGVYEKQPNKARKRVGWEPIAIYIQDDSIVLANRTIIITDPDRINQLWTYCAGNPISEETWRLVAEQGKPWPDSHETAASIPVANTTSEASFQTIAIKEVPPRPIHERIETAIKEAADQLGKYHTIESDEQASKARSLQQRFLDFRSDATKHYEEANRPLLDEQKRLRGIWFPLRDEADQASNILRDAMGRWEDTKRKAAQIAAERAEAGQDNTGSNVPPPSAQIKGGSGRAASVKVETVVVSIDVDQVFAQFKSSPDVVELLTKLAQRAIRAGIAVPGAVCEQRSVVR